MAKVLVVDDDPGTRDTFVFILHQAGFDSAAVGKGSDALVTLGQEPFDLLLLDLQLPDMTGLDVLRSLAEQALTTKVVVMTGFGSIQATVEAMRLGAVDFVEKPLSDVQVIQLVEQTLLEANLHTGVIPSPSTPAACRWVQMVVLAMRLPDDPRTLDELARACGVSVPTLKNRCRAVGLSARSSLAFARLLRAVYQANCFGSRPSTFLDSDPRTCKHLFEVVQIAPNAVSEELSVAGLLREQGLVSEPSVLATLRRALQKPASLCVRLCTCLCLRNVIEGAM